MNKRLCFVAVLALSTVLMWACDSIPGPSVATPTAALPTATQPPPTLEPAPTTPVPPTTAALPATATMTAPTVEPPPTLMPVTATPEMTPLPKPTAGARILLSQVSPAEALPAVVHVAGKAQVFEAMLTVSLVDANDQVLATGYARASQGAPEWGDFSIDFYYPPPSTLQQVTLQAYEPSPKDGSPNSLVETAIILLPVPDLANWQSFENPTYGFTVKHPPTWHLNQGSMMPAPPLATKFSTYQLRTPGEPLGEGEAEVWITVSDVPSVAEMDDLKQRGYTETAVVVGGRQGVRYSAPQPGHGVYDVVYTLSGRREYRIQLSAATRNFDWTFALVLATFTTSE